MQQLLLLKLVCLCMLGKVRQMRSTSGVLSRFVTAFTVWMCVCVCVLNYSRFARTISLSQGSVATYARCGVIFNNHFAANLLRNLQ